MESPFLVAAYYVRGASSNLNSTFLWARRNAYAKENQRLKYLALYELETVGIQAFDKKVQEIGMATVERGRQADYGRQGSQASREAVARASECSPLQRRKLIPSLMGAGCSAAAGFSSPGGAILR